MTPIRFDAETATLRLDRETFDAMVAYAAQPTGEAAHLAELREAGAYRDGRFHPRLEEGLDAVLNPVCRLEVRVAGAHGREGRCHGWVAGGAAGLLLPDREGLYEFVVVHPGFVPERLARVVGLGPRPRAQAAARLELGTGLLDELTAADPGRRTGAGGRHPGPPGSARCRLSTPSPPCGRWSARASAWRSGRPRQPRCGVGS